MFDFLTSDYARMTVTFTFENEEGEELAHTFDARAVVCGSCDGRGTTTEHVDGHGITADEWRHEWGEEERELYLSGGYDRPCPTCGGRRVELEVLRDAADPAMLAKLDDWFRMEALDRAERAGERRAGC